MILTGDRKEEILERAKNRTVNVMVTMSTPTNQPIKPDYMGMIVEQKKPVIALSHSFAQGAYFWQTDDTCVPLAAKNPTLLQEILEAVAVRKKRIESKELFHLDFDEEKALFNSNDLINKANGVPTRLSYTFQGSSENLKEEIRGLPFKKIQKALLHLQESLEGMGGKLHTADIAHTTSMSAFDYYEISIQKAGIGRLFTYGDVMLARGYNLLGSMGIPLVQRNKNGLMLN